ncbi:MAG: DUF4386 domain-containing protein [Candidatus Thorarchaeota archaeon]|jgi:hypothetical protein
MNQQIPLDRVECARNAGVFILIRTLIGMFIFLSLGTFFYVPAAGMLHGIQSVKVNVFYFILIVVSLIPMFLLSIVISFPLNNSLKSVDKEISWHAARLRILDALIFLAGMILLIAEIPLFYQVFLISLVLYSLHLILVGYLIFKSEFLSRVLGIFLIIGGVFGYLFQTLTGFLASDLVLLSTIGGEIAINIEIALALILIYKAKTTTFEDDDSKSRVFKILRELGEATTKEIVAEASKDSDECKDRAPRTLKAMEIDGEVTKRFSKEKKGYVWTLFE